MIREIKARFKEINDKIVFKCPECSQKLRIPLYKTKTLTVKCPKCNSKFSFDYKKYHFKKKFTNSLLICVVLISLFLVVAAPLLTSSKLKNNLKLVSSENKKHTCKLKNQSEEMLANLAEEYTKKLAKVDNDLYRNELQQKANDHYGKIWEERNNFNARYAITPREKAQLQMSMLSHNITKKLENIISEIAKMASPKNSTINVYKTSNGLRLDIDFDMSELTSGELGSRTKHNTVNSLKKEVVRLISKVTNDVYGFCQDLDLATIAIGCKHHVNYEYTYGKSIKNVVLYKVRLDKNDLRQLESNPFLDIYSTTSYFKVEEDDFPNITIEKSL